MQETKENLVEFRAMEGITSENFMKICRCCVVNKGDMDVFDVKIRKEPISNLIFTFTKEMICRSDGLPIVICDICMELIANFDKFIKTFNEAQVIMRKWLVLKDDEKSNKYPENILLEDRKLKIVEENSMKHISNETKQIQNATTEPVMMSMSNEEDLAMGEKGSKCIENNFTIESCSEDLLSEEDDSQDKSKKKPNKRMEVDPNLRSGLDLQCFQCLMVFPSRAEMLKHHEATSHTMAPNYKCSICLKAISKRKAYWDHMAMHRHLKKKAVCEVCGAVVVSLHLKRHMLVHQDKTHMCQICGKGYVQKNTLTEHVKRKHGSDDKDMNTLCFVCGKLCSDLKSLTTHLNTHACDGDAVKGLSHRCDDCGKYFLNAQSLSTHAYMAHKVTERIPKQHKRSKIIRQKSKKITKAKKDKSELSQVDEKKIVTKREPIECPVCKRMICYLGYKRHLTTHSGVKPHQCKYCQKSFRLYTSLKSHTYVHLDIKPFKCDVCGQQFRHYTTLKVHRRVHTDEKPYSCPVCNKGFRSASGLKRHQNQRQHHKSDSAKSLNEESDVQQTNSLT